MALASIGRDYSDSGSDIDEKRDRKKTTEESTSSTGSDSDSASSSSDSERDTKRSRKYKRTRTPPTGINSFFSGEHLSSDSESSSDDERRKSKKLQSPSSKRLPSALSTLSGGVPTNSSSIFHTEYAEAEAASVAVLEKHVKLTEQEQLDASGKKRLPCKLFRKGRCRRGKNCRYSHALPTQFVSQPDPVPFQSEAGSDAIGLQNQGLGDSNAAASQPPPAEYSSGEVRYQTSDWDYSEEPTSTSKKSKKRVGVTNSLVPPKRALEAFAKQQQ